MVSAKNVKRLRDLLIIKPVHQTDAVIVKKYNPMELVKSVAYTHLHQKIVRNVLGINVKKTKGSLMEELVKNAKNTLNLLTHSIASQIIVDRIKGCVQMESVKSVYHIQGCRTNINAILTYAQMTKLIYWMAHAQNVQNILEREVNILVKLIFAVNKKFFCPAVIVKLVIVL